MYDQENVIDVQVTIFFQYTNSIKISIYPADCLKGTKIFRSLEIIPNFMIALISLLRCVLISCLKLICLVFVCSLTEPSVSHTHQFADS